MGVATGETHTVQEFVEFTFKDVNLDFGEYVKTTEKYLRPNEVNFLLGDSSKAQKELVDQTSFRTTVKMMVENDLRLAKQESFVRTRTN